MKVVALVSGGKDSCYSMYLCSQHGHEVVALANLLPQEAEPDDLDSYMYQTVRPVPARKARSSSRPNLSLCAVLAVLHGRGRCVVRHTQRNAPTLRAWFGCGPCCHCCVAHTLTWGS